MLPITVFIFTKPNRMGLSKTRLARDISFSEARRVNAMATARVLRNLHDPRWMSVLMVAPDLSCWSVNPDWPAHYLRLPQGDGNLGDRLAHAFDLAPHGKVIFTGTDQPDVSAKDIWRACLALQNHDAVFGPADDGGFWLMGMNKRIGTRTPFANVRWSSEHTLSDVCTNLRDQKIAMLERRIDLDDGEAMRQWRAQNNRIHFH